MAPKEKYHFDVLLNENLHLGNYTTICRYFYIVYTNFNCVRDRFVRGIYETLFKMKIFFLKGYAITHRN